MIELRDDELRFDFPDLDKGAKCSINFQRTLRIPDDNRDYPLPPGLSPFPLQRVDDFADRLPDSWKTHGGVFLPMYQTEAMWLSFRSSGSEYPFAIRIAAGKIDAITGEPWSEGLKGGENEKQNYVVIPGQPWLDGFYAGEGHIRQFVAMPLGEGYTAEEQLTGAAEHGGLQIAVYPMKQGSFEELRRAREREEAARRARRRYSSGPNVLMCVESAPPTEMGLAPGGLMRQKIYEDRHGIDAWDQSAPSRCFVHLLNSVQYLQATGHRPPTEAPTALDYSNAGLPWFELGDQEQEAVKHASKLLGLDSVAATHLKKGRGPLADNHPLTSIRTRTLSGSHIVREGDF